MEPIITVTVEVRELKNALDEAYATGKEFWGKVQVDKENKEEKLSVILLRLLGCE